MVAPSRPAGERWILPLIVASTALRLLLGRVVGLSVDESYATVMSRQLSLSYFDHPPMMFWWAGLAARVAGSEDRLVVRLPFILAFAATTWLLFRLAAFLFGRDAGLWTAVLLNLSLYFSVVAGGWVLPDGPLLLFSVAAAYCLARATLSTNGPRASLEASASPRPEARPWWIGYGVCAGLALLAKYHACFLLLGAGAFLASSRRRSAWLARREPYLAVACSVLLFTPVLAWNLSHDWASFRFQTGRAVPITDTWGTPFLDTLGGQATWILPWIWIPLVVVLFQGLRTGSRDDGRWLLVCLGAGPVFGFTLLTAFGSRGLPHWEAPGYFMLLPLLGAAVARRLEQGRRRGTAVWLAGCVAGFLLVLGGFLAHLRTGWIARASPQVVSRGDPTDDLLDWTPVAEQLRAWSLPAPGSVLATARWDDAAKLAYAMGASHGAAGSGARATTAVTCVGEDARGFAYVRDPEADLGGNIVLVVRRRPGAEPMRAYAPFFASLRSVGSVAIPRGNGDGVVVSVYFGTGLKRRLPRLRTL